jgi:hypothetical protein
VRPDADDLALVGSKYAALYPLLKMRGLVSWGSTDAVPDEAVQPLVQMLSYVSAQSFGQQSALYATGELDVTPPMPAERQLRRNLAHEYVATPATSEYF